METVNGALAPASDAVERVGTPAMAICAGVTTVGKPCRAPAQPGSSFCQWHDPAGKPVASLPAPAPAPDLQLPEPAALHSAAGLRALLAQVILYTASAPVPDLPRVHALSAVAVPLLRSLDTRGLEADLAAARAEAERARYEASALRLELDTARRQVAALSLPSEVARPQAAPDTLPQQVADLARANTLFQKRAETEAARAAAALQEASHARAAHSGLSAAVLGVRPRLCFHCARLLRRSGALPPAAPDDPDYGDDLGEG